MQIISFKDTNKLKIFISVILMLSVLTIINYKKIRSEKKDTKNIGTIENRLVDVDGRTLDKSHLKDKIIYLQFVNAINSNDMELFDAVCENWNDNRIVKIGIFEENGRIIQMKNKYSPRSALRGCAFFELIHP